MKIDEQPYFAKLLWQLGEIYSKEITPSLTQIYWESLCDYTLLDIHQAARLHILDVKQGGFFPKPSNFVYWIRNNIETYALIAWNKVEAAVKQIGAYDSVAFDDPLIHFVIEKLGGWIHLCGKTHNELFQIAQRFLGYYNKSWPATTETYPDHLQGIFELSNKRLGLPIVEPRLIGNDQEAKKVIANGQSSQPLQLIQQNKCSGIMRFSSAASEKDGEQP